MSIKVVIADDHKVVIDGLRFMLHDIPQIKVIAFYESGSELMDGLKQEIPDVLLLDIQMPDKTGDELASIINKLYPSVAILAMTAFNMTYYVKLMLQKGAKGYLLKNTDSPMLVNAIETVYRGETFIDPLLKEQVLEDMLTTRKSVAKKPTLTRREKEVLQLILQEHTSQEIADKLEVSLRTVENQRVNLMQKLDVKNTAGLVKAAIKLGLEV